MSAKLVELLNVVDEAEKASAERLKRANHEGEARAGMVLMLFESMPGVPEADEALGRNWSRCSAA